jgi:hypothetical protein
LLITSGNNACFACEALEWKKPIRFSRFLWHVL